MTAPAPYRPAANIGDCAIEALQFLYGCPWDDIAMAFVQALAPKTVRLVQDSAAHLGPNPEPESGRVTVHLTEDCMIECIVWEVTVGLPHGIKDGFDLAQRTFLPGVRL